MHVCKNLIYTLHTTHNTVHSTQYTVHSTQYTVHSTQYTVHSTQYTVHTLSNMCVFAHASTCMRTCIDAYQASETQ